MNPQIEQFIAPQRAAYEMIKNEAFMKRTREAYEKYFAIAEKARSLPELKQLAEKGNLPLRLNSSPVYDSYSLLFETHDPNLQPLCAREESLMSAAEEARSADELRYLVELAVRRSKRELAVEEFHAFLTVMLAGKILSYDIGKANARLSPEQFLAGFIMMREEIITTYTIMVELFGLDWETIIDTPRRMRELLLFENLSSQTSRIACALDPQNIEWMREMLFEEILTEKSTAQLLLRRSRLVFHPSVPAESSDEALRKIARAGWEKIKHFEWADETKMLY